MGGLASAAFYGAGKAVEAVKSGVRSNVHEGDRESKLQEIFGLADNYTLSEDTFNNHILDRHGPNSTYRNKSHFDIDFDI